MTRNKYPSVRQLWGLGVVSLLLLTGCELSLPGGQPATVAPPQGAAEEFPSEADLYATAIASLGGQLTETAAVPWETAEVEEGEKTPTREVIEEEEEGGGIETTATPRYTSTPRATVTPYAYGYGGGQTTYVVQRGDWLYRIAAMFGVSANAILAANPALQNNPNKLIPGQVLIIPAAGTYTYPYPFATSNWLPEYYWSYGTPVPYATSAWLPEAYWNYGPTNWGTLSPAYATCSSGRSQSPINLETATTVARDLNLEFHYSPADLWLVSNEFTFQVDYPRGSFVQIEGVVYELLNFTFHMPSEHTINGNVFDMELQLVHQNASGQKAIVSVLLSLGDRNDVLDKIWQVMPAPPYNWSEVAGFDASDLLPENLSAYQYSGSLTTPPCTEGVVWVVMATPIEFSQEQLNRFSSMFPGNARPLQALNGRTVYFDAGGQ